MTDLEFEVELRKRLGHPVDRICIYVCGCRSDENSHLHIAEYTRSWGCSGQMHEILSLLAALQTGATKTAMRVLQRYCEDNKQDFREKLGYLQEFIQTMMADENLVSGSVLYQDLGKLKHGTDDLKDKAP